MVFSQNAFFQWFEEKTKFRTKFGISPSIYIHGKTSKAFCDEHFHSKNYARIGVHALLKICRYSSLTTLIFNDFLLIFGLLGYFLTSYTTAEAYSFIDLGIVCAILTFQNIPSQKYLSFGLVKV